MSRSLQPASRVLAPASVAWLCACAATALADGYVDVSLGAGYDSNLTRAQAPQDRRADRWLDVAASIRRYEAITGYDVVSATIDARAARFDRYRGLDVVAVGATASYRRKLGLGLDAPYFVATASYAREEYDVDVRDGHRVAIGAEIGRRFGTRTDVAAGVGYERRDGDTNRPIVPGISGAIFDLTGVTAYARVDVTPAAAWTLGLRASVRRGDVESTSQRSPEVFRASDAIAEDPAFNDPLLFGYRLRGTTWSIAAGASRAIGDRSAVDVTIVQDDTRAAEGLRYRGHGVRAAFIHRF